jgi:hypothetical protein
MKTTSRRRQLVLLILVVANVMTKIRGALNRGEENFATKRLGSVSALSSSVTITRALQATAAPTSGPSTGTNTGSSQSSNNNDDMFRVSGKTRSRENEQNQTFESFLKGTGCKNIECRVFLLVGYVTVGVGVAAAYRLSRSTEWRVPPSVSQFEIKRGVQYFHDEDGTVAYRRKQQWDDSRTLNRV